MRGLARELFGRKRLGYRVMAMILAAVAAAPVSGQERGPKPKPGKGVPAAEAIRKGLAHLAGRQGKDGRFPSKHSKDYPGGPEALAALTLLWGGVDPKDDSLVRTLHYLDSIAPQLTYTRSLRAMVYALIGTEDARRRMGEDVSWLVRQQQRNGGWGYGPASPMTRIVPDWTDASNSYLALWALREASDAGSAVPLQTWRQAEAFWRGFQRPDGGWGYQPAGGKRPPQRVESHGSMTAAGMASYFVLVDRFPQGRGGLPYGKRLTDAAGWLTKNWNLQKVPKYVWLPQPSQLYYYLLALSRVGMESGAGSMGGKDCAREIADVLGRKQSGDGDWEGNTVDTALATLCLMHANAPIAIARLQLDDSPGPDPRDAAQMARWLARKLRTPVAWRALASKERIDPGRCPLLYINAGPKAPRPDGLDKFVKDYLGKGGTLLIQAPDGKAARDLSDWVRQFATEASIQPPADDHPVFTLKFSVDPSRRPKLLTVSDTTRTLAVVCSDDVASVWHKGRYKNDTHLFALAGNVMLMAGEGKLPAGRLGPAVKRERVLPPPARRSVKIARLKHGGDFKARPAVVKRLADGLLHSLSTELVEAKPVDAAEKVDPSIRILWMTGTKATALGDVQQANLKAYLHGGGTLLIVPAGKDPQFRKTVVTLMEQLFGVGQVATSRPDSPLVTGSFAGGIGADLSKPPSGSAPTFRGGRVGRRIAAILCPDGLAEQIEAPAGAASGEYARKLALNVILYAMTYGQTPAGQ